jgi:hypothetical protein
MLRPAPFLCALRKCPLSGIPPESSAPTVGNLPSGSEEDQSVHPCRRHHCRLRASLDEAGQNARPRPIVGDGSFCNRTLFTADLPRTELIVRARRDLKLCGKADGDSRSFYDKVKCRCGARPVLVDADERRPFRRCVRPIFIRRRPRSASRARSGQAEPPIPPFLCFIAVRGPQAHPDARLFCGDRTVCLLMGELA